MKCYATTFDLARPADAKIWVPPYSDFAIGIKIVKDGAPIDPEEWYGEMYKGSRGSDPLTPEPSPVGEWGVYVQKSGAPGQASYLVDVIRSGASTPVQTFRLTVVTTGSPVFEMGSAGGGLTPQAALPGVTITTTGKIGVDFNAVPAYEGSSLDLGGERFDIASLQNSVTSLTSDMLTSNYVKEDALTSNYYDKEQLTSYVPSRGELNAVANQVAGKADASVTPVYQTDGETGGQMMELGDVAYETTTFSGEYEDGGTFELKVLANKD